jgi:RecA-family ATPase
MKIDVLDAFSKEPEPLDFVLPGLLAGTVGAIVSPGGAGKSMMALELAILVASGRDLSGFGRGVQLGRGQVGFLAAEDPAKSICHRLYSLGKHLDPTTRDLVAQRVSIDALLGQGLDIGELATQNRVRKAATGKRLVFLDTLRRFHSSDENDSKHMSKLLSQLEGLTKETGATILFLHHASKFSALNGQGDTQQASRGSSVLTDNIRWQMNMMGASEKDAAANGIANEMRGHFVRASIAKQNYGPPFKDIWMLREAGGVLVPAEFSTCSVTKVKRNKGRPRESM